MRKKGKCIFAHGPLELRVKESRRGKWPLKSVFPAQNSYNGEEIPVDLRSSGGEDLLGAARSIEKIRAAEGSVSDFEKSSNKKSPLK